jgi:hypothetical protein
LTQNRPAWLLATDEFLGITRVRKTIFPEGGRFLAAPKPGYASAGLSIF